MNQKEKVLFKFAKTNCPHCNKESEFGITQKIGKFKFGFIPLHTSTICNIICLNCGFTSLIDENKLDLYEEASIQYEYLVENLLSIDAYWERVHSLNLEVLENIIKETEESWDCPTCKENNPVSFEICWKCGYDTGKECADNEINLPDTGSGHPWEQ